MITQAPADLPASDAQANGNNAAEVAGTIVGTIIGAVVVLGTIFSLLRCRCRRADGRVIADVQAGRTF